MIATVVAAVVLGNFGPGRALTDSGSDAIDTVWEFLAYLLTALVFLLVGLAIPPARLLGSLGPIFWAVAAMLVGRALVVYGLLGAGSRFAPLPGLAAAMPRPWLHVLFWAGLRGAVAVAMALALPVDLPQRALLQEITFGAVLFTLLVQATTIGRVVERLRPGTMRRPISGAQATRSGVSLIEGRTGVRLPLRPGLADVDALQDAQPDGHAHQ